MSTLTDLLTPLVSADQPLPAPFRVLLPLHVLAGLVAVVAGAGAALSRKRRGRHPRLGTVYYTASVVIFLTAVVMGTLRWAQDWHLVVLGTLSFGAASVGFAARRMRWQGWLSCHIIGMGLSYPLLLTAFYVDNGARLPVWDHLPEIAYWILPSLVGLPLIVRAVSRHTRPARRPRHGTGPTP